MVDRIFVLTTLMFFAGIIFRKNEVFWIFVGSVMGYVLSSYIDYLDGDQFSQADLNLLIFGFAGIVGGLIGQLGSGIFKKPQLISIK